MAKNSRIPIVLICDDNFVVPTGVAISSIVSSKNLNTYYDIYIVCASLSEDRESIFLNFNADKVSMHIIREDANRFASLHKYNLTQCPAPPVALLKFILPDIFANYDKILYLDGDVLVRIDLTELYEIELGNNLLAAVRTSSVAYKSGYDIVPDYFNSGVMLLNLKQMRRENTTAALIRTKIECGYAYLMDQYAFNLVCTGRVKLLPIRYNLLAVILEKDIDKWTAELLNPYFGTNYASQEELLRDGAIIHFAAKDKPWKDPCVIYADEWLQAYRSVPALYKEYTFYFDILNSYKEKACKNKESAKIIEQFGKYFMARVDVKLLGESADFELQDISDIQANVMIPSWLQKGGKGYQIETCKGKLDISFKVKIDGKLNIYLRGKDIRDADGIKRIPYWINYNVLAYNGITEFKEAKYAWHDKPIIISHQVKAGETVYLHIEWQPCKMQDPELPKRLKDTEKKLKASLSREASLKSSVSFRTGRAITWFPRKVRGGMRCLKDHGPAYTVKRFFWHITH